MTVDRNAARLAALGALCLAVAVACGAEPEGPTTEATTEGTTEDTHPSGGVAGRFGGHPLSRWSILPAGRGRRGLGRRTPTPGCPLGRSCRRAPGLGLGDRLPHAAHAHRAAGRLRGGGGVPRVQVGHAGHPRGGRALHALAQHHRRAHLGAAGAGGRDAGHGPRVPRALPEPGAAGRRPGRARAAPRHAQDRRGRGPLPAQHAAGGEPRGAALSAQLPDHVQREHRARAAPGGGAGPHPGRVHRGTRAHLLQRHHRCATASTPGSTRAAW
jgi:hypothetical protein